MKLGGEGWGKGGKGEGRGGKGEGGREQGWGVRVGRTVVPGAQPTRAHQMAQSDLALVPR